jgi:hypothetical protein
MTSDYDATCAFILNHGRAAQISPKALAYLKRFGGKKVGWHSI